jgi:gluconate:H+ symporter, GntP family
MTISFVQALIVLFVGIGLIVLLTARFRIHAFFALIAACMAVGLGNQLPVPEVITAVKDGFGDIMKSLGILIVLGTTLGVVLEHTGSTAVMANYILGKVNRKYSGLAMAVTGFIVGLPIFCDSGFIVLSGLNKSLAKKTNISPVTMSVSLASGLYSIHCLIPPHPGAAAAAGLMTVDFGRLILIGILVAIPGMLTGYLWASYAGKKHLYNYGEDPEEAGTQSVDQPSVIKSFLPIVVPIALIALKSFLLIGSNAASLAGWKKALSIIGDPVSALTIGVLLAFYSGRSWKKDTISRLLHDAVEKAGGILVIIGAGGAFGAVLQATKIGEHFNSTLPLAGLGILFPFLLTSILKTALGSSTVAIITAASIVFPLLGALGLNNENGWLLCALSMGAGSMMISHANDAYFWVISKFSEIEMKTMLKVYTMATILMGLVSFAFVYMLSLILL